MRNLLRWLGNEAAIENARLASTALSRRRVEREDVEIFLAGLHARTCRAVGEPGSAVASR